MYPESLRLISRSLNHELDKEEREAVETADAWKVIHMLEGMPKQQVDTHLTGELTILDQLRALTDEQLSALLALVEPGESQDAKS